MKKSTTFLLRNSLFASEIPFTNFKKHLTLSSLLSVTFIKIQISFIEKK